MTDRRTTPNPNLVDGMTPAQIGAPFADLRSHPGGLRDRQLLHGDPVTVLGHRDGCSYVRSDKDGYLGFVDASQVQEPTEPTHIVTGRSTHAYARPDIKSEDRAVLSFGARLTATAESPSFVETSLGHVPKAQVAPLPYTATTTDTAQVFLGVPYLWGGNTSAGIDCSGLVQIALLTAGLHCPGDSDLQQQALRATDGSDPRPGDLIFWKGHVAIHLDAKTLIHANAHHMAVTVEPLQVALARIAQQEFGAVTGHARPAHAVAKVP